MSVDPEQVGQGAVMDGESLGDLQEPDQLQPVQALGPGLVPVDLGQPGIDGGVGGVPLVAQPLACEELGHHHPPRVRDQLGHVPVIEPREVTAHPVEPQVGLAGKEEQVWVAGDERGALLFWISEAHRGLIAGERDVDDRAHTELHAVMDQVLNASRQSPRERPNLSDSDHALTVAPGGDNQAPLLSAQRNPDAPLRTSTRQNRKVDQADDLACRRRHA